VRGTLPPSAEIEDQIDWLLAVGVGEDPRQSLSELAKLGAHCPPCHAPAGSASCGSFSASQASSALAFWVSS
jgi:hypothetical protein